MQTPTSKFTSTVIEETIIKPQSPSDGSVINFSRQDRITPAIPVPLLSFYDKRLDHKALAESLARVLVKFPILAGTFHAVEGKPPTAVELNDAGVVFQVAETDATLYDFGEFSFRKNKEAFLLPLVNNVPTSVLTVKITYLKKTEDGREGTVVGTSMHHYVVDAESNALFINAWAEETRGKGEGGSAFPQPIHDRSMMDALVSKPGEEGRMADPPSWQYKDPAEFMADITRWVQTKLPGAKAETVNFSKEGLEKLKTELSPESGWISTNDALVALVWQATTIMRKTDDNRNMKLGFALNTRKRFDPPLPSGYFGNAIQYVVVQLPASRIKTMPLKELAERIRSAVNNFSDTTVRAHLTWLKEQTENRGGDMTGLQHNWETDDLALTSWASYPLYGSDFGAGKPIWVVPGYGNAPGFIMFLPTAEGGIRAMIHFAADEEEHFDAVTLPLLQQYS